MDSSVCSDGDVNMEVSAATSESPSQLLRIEIDNHSGLLSGYTAVKKILDKRLRLKHHKIKVSGKLTPSIIVMFICEEDQEAALKAINDFVWKDQKLCAKKIDPVDFVVVQKTQPVAKSSVEQAIQKANSLIQKVNLMTDSTADDSEQKDTGDSTALKRKAELSNNDGEVKKVKIKNMSVGFISSLVRQATVPFWNIPYEEQLIRKEKDATKILTKLTTELMKANPVLQEYYSQQSGEDNLCCPLPPCIGTLVTPPDYNKFEMDIGLHPDSRQPTVGFQITCKSFTDRCVAEASYCSNVSEKMIKAAELFQAYIRVSSWPVFDPTTYEGFWRQLIVRTSRKDHLLLIVVIHPQNLPEEEIEDRKRKLKAFFSGSDLGVTSLYFQKSVTMNKYNSQLQHVYGDTHIEEKFLGLNLRISPVTSFPANTLGAEELFLTVKEFALLTKQSTVLYLCCGPGAIAASLAKDVSKVIGIDASQSAVEDAWHNVRTNDIQNAEFICGKVEEVIHRLLTKLANEEDVIAILEPPKTGLNNKVTRALRSLSGLRRLIYMTSSPQQAMPTYVDLCRPTSANYKGTSFQPVKAAAMDLFPHTTNWELVLLFERQ